MHRIRETTKDLLKYLIKSRIYAFFIAFLVFLLLLLTALVPGLPLLGYLDYADERMLDFYFLFKTQGEVTHWREGVSQIQLNPKASQDIVLVGIDEYSLEMFGRWPFPRSVHAQLLKSLARVQNQQARENSVLLDIFFLEPSRDAVEDALFLAGIVENDRTFLEVIAAPGEIDVGYTERMFQRLDALLESPQGRLRVRGDTSRMYTFLSVEAPLTVFGRSSRGWGHAIFVPDSDDIFRRQILVLKLSRLLEEFPFLIIPEKGEGPPQIVARLPSLGEHQRLAFLDQTGYPSALNPDLLGKEEEILRILQEASLYRLEDSDADGVPDQRVYYLRLYQDLFIPSITLALAARYFGKTLDELEVTIGESIVIPQPKVWDPEVGGWKPYRLPPGERPLEEIRIPIDDKGQMIVNFLGPRTSSALGGYRNFHYISYADLARRITPEDPQAWPLMLPVENKILMVGPFSAGMADDEKATPFGMMYGVEIHAHALNTILMNDFLYRIPPALNILLALGLILLVAYFSSRLPTLFALPVGIVLLVIVLQVYLWVFNAYNLYIPFVYSAFGISMTFLGTLAFRVSTEEFDKKRIRNMFAKYVSPEVVNQILEKPPELGGVDRELTVLFSDVRGFTSLSESMSAQELVRHLNVYLTAMTDLIMEYRGTLDKYVGDEIMCFWGAPLDEPDHALLAAQCALRMMDALRELNERWPENRKIDIGIGINSGIMTVGNMGSPGRMNYTLMGDNVNLGARLEGTNKEYGTNIIISEFTYALIADQGAIVRELDNIRVKGKNKPVVIYELLGFEQGYSPPGIKKR